MEKPQSSIRCRLPALIVISGLVVSGGLWLDSGRTGAAERPDGGFIIIRDPRMPVRRRQFQSWQARQQQNVVMQQRDFSCGAAALATLCRYYFQDDITEADILERVVDNLSEEELVDREDNGLSLNDLFVVAKDLGYLAAAVELQPEKIPELQAPVIVRIEKHGYKHFVVLRGSVEDRIYLADPLRGNVRLPAEKFLRQWSGEALVLGKAGFGLPQDHPLAIRQAPPVRHELETFRRSLYLRRMPVPR